MRNEELDHLAQGVLVQIRNMQEHGYFFGTEYQGRLPQVRSFSELHDYFDANVGWGGEFEAACEASDFADIANPVFGRVDKALRLGLNTIIADERIHVGDHVRVVIDQGPGLEFFTGLTGVVTVVKGDTFEDMVVAFRDGGEIRELSFTESELEKLS